MTPEEESKKNAHYEYDRLIAAASDLGMAVDIEETVDYVVIWVLLEDWRNSERRLLLKLKCDDYPQQAPFLECVNPKAFIDRTLRGDVKVEFYPLGSHIAVDHTRSPMPIICIPGHRLYHANNWHPQTPWVNPPKEQHTIYGFVTRVRSAFLDTWTQK